MAPDPDLLASVEWECAATLPGAATVPDDLDALPLRWIAASVPGTAAAALRDGGVPERSSAELDGEDWWFRCVFPGSNADEGEGGVPPPDRPGGWVLELAGLATIADVWLNGGHLLHSETMFVPRRLGVDGLLADNRLCIRFAALQPALATRRRRPRWKSRAASDQNLRWLRTTLLGRQPGWAVTPAPVGPWRPVRLAGRTPLEVVDRRVVATCGGGHRRGTTGRLSVELRCAGTVREAAAILEVGGSSAPLAVETEGAESVIRGSIVLADVDRWWPHTHGPQPLYPASLLIDGERVDLGSVGFRTVEVDDGGGGFQLVVNGVPVFCRGACWYPLDPVSFAAPADQMEATLSLARDAGMNMVRIPGGTVYEDDTFFTICDRLGIMVWQDAMLGFLDPPDDADFTTAILAELTVVLPRVSAHPSLAVICGGQELEEQPAMFGLDRERWQTPLITEVIPVLASELAPGVPYLTSSPSGGPLPFQVDHGVSHYAGVGIFLRPLADLRGAAPRFVSEGLAFAVPPEQTTVDSHCGGARQAGHDPEWKRSIHHDTGGSWDLEDVRDHYVASLFDVEPTLLRRSDPERALDLGRAAVAEVMSEAMAEWRRPGSPCAGLLVVGLRDLRIGAGWGVVDALGRPKAPFFALARASQPVAVLLTDEGLNGLGIHLVNDTPTPVAGFLTVELSTAIHRVEQARCSVEVPARGGLQLSADALFDGFRDLTYSYRFGPRSFELVTVTLVGEDGSTLAESGFLPGGLSRSVEGDIGLQIDLEQVDERVWSLSILTRMFAQFVSVDVPGFRPDDSWFHLAPGATRVIGLRREGHGPPDPRGQVRALNSLAAARVCP